jgi:hypothetical protein
LSAAKDPAAGKQLRQKREVAEYIPDSGKLDTTLILNGPVRAVQFWAYRANFGMRPRKIHQFPDGTRVDNRIWIQEEHEVAVRLPAGCVICPTETNVL